MVGTEAELAIGAVEEEGGGKGAIPGGVDFLGPFGVVVVGEEDGFGGDVVFLDEGDDARLEVARVVQADEDNFQLFISVGILKMDEMRHLFDTWRAVGGPKVDDIQAVVIGCESRSQVLE